MSSSRPPTDDELNRLTVLATRPENRAYFFERLDNPAWLEALAQRSFFDSPPEPESAGEGYVRFPAWPEGRYLARVASDAAEAAAQVLVNIPDSGNPRVVSTLLDAASRLPPEQLDRVSGRISDWLESPYPEYFIDEAAQLAESLMSSGMVGRGLSVVESMLRVLPDPRRVEQAAPDSPLQFPTEPVGRVSEYEYERFLEQVLAPMVDAAGIVAVRVLSRLLESAVQLSGRADADYSHIWRPAIEPHDQNSDTGIRHVLVDAVRDAALRHAMSGAKDATDELVALLKDGPVLHRRILLHALAMGFGDRDVVSELLESEEAFHDHRLRHEYAALLRTRFDDAESGAQQVFLQRVEDGPDLDEYAARSRQLRGVEPDDADLRQYEDRWRRDWLSFVEPYLSGDVAREYAALVEAEGEPDHPDFLSWSSSDWVGPESPISDDERAGMSPSDLLRFAEEWVPEQDGGWRSPSIEGLGRAITAAAKARPQEFASVAHQAQGLDPTYVRSLLSGLEDALRKGSGFEWPPVLELAAFAVQQPFEPDRLEPDRDRDPGWRWCRRTVASLLRTGFADSSGSIPPSQRRTVWAMLERLTRDPNPSPEHEEQFGGDNMDPLTLSINTNRGTAMHAVVEYALWTRRGLEADGQDVAAGFAAMPEVADVLEEHLDIEADPSLAVRAVYGRWLPWLLLLDESWTVRNLERILPDDPSLELYRDTAWATYVAWCPAYDTPFRVLRDHYLRAAQWVPSELSAGTFSRESLDEKLGEHLVTFNWRGLDVLEIVREFFARASDELAARVMEFVGRTLRNTPAGEVPASVRARIQELWEWRLDEAGDDPHSHVDELRAFGVTFSSGQLDEDWSLSALATAIDLAGAPRIGKMVAERLATIAEVRPVDAVLLFAKMLLAPGDAWSHIGLRDEARAILAAAMTTSDSAAHEAAEDVVDLYVQRGELDFRSLVAPR